MEKLSLPILVKGMQQATQQCETEEKIECGNLLQMNRIFKRNQTYLVSQSAYSWHSIDGNSFLLASILAGNRTIIVG
jgi:hypothetical protein